MTHVFVAERKHTPPCTYRRRLSELKTFPPVHLVYIVFLYQLQYLNINVAVFPELFE